MSTIIDALKRLERAGSESSWATNKLREAAKELAKYVERIVPDDVDLPRGYWATTRSSNVGSCGFLNARSPERCEYTGDQLTEAIDGWDGYLHGDFNRPVCAPSRETVLKFAADVADGWLDELAEWLEKRTAEEDAATDTLETATAKLAD